MKLGFLNMTKEEMEALSPDALDKLWDGLIRDDMREMATWAMGEKKWKLQRLALTSLAMFRSAVFFPGLDQLSRDNLLSLFCDVGAELAARDSELAEKASKKAGQ